VYIEKELGVQLMKNGGKNKSGAFLISITVIEAQLNLLDA